MFISLKWINDYIDLHDISEKEIVEKLIMCSAEVESAQHVGKHFEQVRAAKIEKIENHPNSDKLHLATIFDGENRSTVVCGAQNIAEGQIVPYAPLGSILPGDFEIKPAVIRGVESCGMLCSAKELGLGEDHSGIWQLDLTIKPGTKMSELMGESDFIIEIENKTINHRPDLWGHYGFAREFKAMFGKPWKKELKYSTITPDKIDETFSISLESEKALHYVGFKMSNIVIAPSPLWMQNRLRNIGLRPINNIVDITNYVMYETGHPIHAFDRRDISGTKIVVKNNEGSEKFTTLDNVERVLVLTDLVIADEKQTLAIAGVMGGQNSEVKNDTTELFIEIALFDPATIRRTANRLGLRTDAAQRFEKALWVENCYLAAQRFVELTKNIIPSATVSSNIATADNSEKYGFKETIKISGDKIRTLLGVSADDMPIEKIVSILENLEFIANRSHPESCNKGILNLEEMTIEVPAHRRSKDISVAADIVEEVGRIFGYTNIKPVPPFFPMNPVPINKSHAKEEKVRNLITRSFAGHEVMNFSFLTEKERELFPAPQEMVVATLEARDNPYLRYTMAHGMLASIRENLKNFPSFTLFEFGRVYDKTGENKRIVVCTTGAENIFMEMKKIATAIMDTLEIPNWRIERTGEKELFFSKKLMHPGRSAVMVALNKPVGIFGELHPEIARKYDIKGRAGYLEFDFDALIGLPQKSLKFQQLHKFPSTSFDLTMLAPLKTEAETMLSIIRKSVDKKILSDLSIVARYEGAGVPEGFMSISFRVVLNGGDRTLTGEEMKATQEKVIAELSKKGFNLK